MKRLMMLALLLMCVPCFAQRTVPTPPAEDNGVFKWTALDSGETVTKNFYFGFAGRRTGYSGYSMLYVYTDSASTATQTVASYDSLKGDAYALDYDEISQQMEQCQTSRCVSETDSINVANWNEWGTGHSDDTFTLSKVLNFGSSDGVRVVFTAMSDLLIRLELKYAQDAN